MAAIVDSVLCRRPILRLRHSGMLEAQARRLVDKTPQGNCQLVLFEKDDMFLR